MSRDHRKLDVFQIADRLTLRIYQISNSFPASERFGVTAQLRRAAVSASSNIVEGCARRSEAEYVNFLNIAAGSVAEAGYLIQLAGRLGFLLKDDAYMLTSEYTLLAAKLQALIRSFAPRRTPIPGTSNHP
jgi:four helix bundle protein